MLIGTWFYKYSVYFLNVLTERKKTLVEESTFGTQRYDNVNPEVEQDWSSTLDVPLLNHAPPERKCKTGPPPTVCGGFQN